MSKANDIFTLLKPKTADTLYYGGILAIEWLYATGSGNIVTIKLIEALPPGRGVNIELTKDRRNTGVYQWSIDSRLFSKRTTNFQLNFAFIDYGKTFDSGIFRILPNPPPVPTLSNPESIRITSTVTILTDPTPITNITKALETPTKTPAQDEPHVSKNGSVFDDLSLGTKVGLGSGLGALVLLSFVAGFALCKRRKTKGPAPIRTRRRLRRSRLPWGYNKSVGYEGVSQHPSGVNLPPNHVEIHGKEFHEMDGTARVKYGVPVPMDTSYHTAQSFHQY